MKKKILIIVSDIETLIKSIYKQRFWINWYGAYDIDPKYLAVWICVESDEAKLNLESNQELASELREVFVEENYPKEAVPFVHIGFESQETVDRESNGDWYKHFK